MKKPRWTQSDDDFLKGNYKTARKEYCIFCLKRGKRAIEHRAESLGLRINDLWSKDEERFLIENYQIHGAAYCSQKINRPINATKHRAKKLNLSKTYHAWSREENSFLINNYPESGVDFCSKFLSRSKREIKNHVGFLKLKRNKHIVPAPEGHKHCKKCNQIKPLEDFAKDGNKKRFDCKICNSNKSKSYANLNKEKVTKRKKEYSKNNRDKINHRMRIWLKKQEFNDIFMLGRRTRSRINTALYMGKHGKRKVDNSIKLLGATFAEYKNYLISKFTPQMTWHLFIDGEIEVHHIKPIYLFEKMDAQEQYEAFHYLNTEPLWKNTATARKYGDLASEGHDECHARIDPILRSNQLSRHPSDSASSSSPPVSDAEPLSSCCRKDDLGFS